VTRIVVDTGPIVALLNRRDHHNAWAREVLATVEPPIVTCEAVLSEACFLLGRIERGPETLLELVARGIIKLDFRLAMELDEVRALMKRFSSVPMSLADACLVRMTELDTESVVLTLDGDFRIYRRNRRLVVPTIMPKRRG